MPVTLDPLASEASSAETRKVISADLRRALDHGGRAVVTVRSKSTGKHVTIRLVAKKKNPDGRGYVSRATIEGRVGLAEADVVFVDDPTMGWPDGQVGSLTPSTGEWKPAKDADPNRVWAVQYALRWALGSYDLDRFAEVFLELSCCYCGKPLTDPVSIDRGIGPDCYGRHTGSRSAARS